MPTTLTERIDSRRIELDGGGVPESAEFIYILRGVADDASASALVTTSTPGAYGQLDRLSIDLEPVHIDTANLGSCIWNVTVHFGKPPENTGVWRFEFDTGGGTQHVTQSKATVHKYAPSGATAPDFKGAIGATKDGVEGVDITAPVMNFTGRYVVGSLSGAYMVQLYQLTGKTNTATWTAYAADGVGIQFDAGEVLFMGASFSRRDDGLWEVVGRFAASPNVTGLTVGDITGIDKKGWEYLWVLYEDSEDTAAKTLVKRPLAAYVERVYDAGNFGNLVMS